MASEIPKSFDAFCPELKSIDAFGPELNISRCCSNLSVIGQCRIR